MCLTFIDLDGIKALNNRKDLIKAMNKLRIPRNAQDFYLKNINSFKHPITPEQRDRVNKNLKIYDKIFKEELNPVQAGLIMFRWRELAKNPEITHLSLYLEVDLLPYILMIPPISLRGKWKALKIQRKIKKAMEAE